MAVLAEQLHQVAQQVRDLLRRTSPAGNLQPYALRAAVDAYPLRGGKMMRPALTLWTCELFGADPMPALPVAAAVEVFHNWTLVHDDIIDNDDLRRGAPSTHRLVQDMQADPALPHSRKFGIDMAILAGDVQQAWSNRLILQSSLPDKLKLALLDRLNGMVNPLLISGEAMDVAFELRPFSSISADEMITMLRYKTAVLLRFAAEAGAMIGLGVAEVDHPQVRALGRFAEIVGLAFQLRDDLLDMFGDEKKLGKPVGSDLRQGKRTFLFTVALENLAEQRDEFLSLLGKPDLTPANLARAGELLRECGAVAATEEKIRAHAEEAHDILTEFNGGTPRDLLQQWMDFACRREY